MLKDLFTLFFPQLHVKIIDYKAAKFEKEYCRINDFYWQEAARREIKFDQASVKEQLLNRPALKNRVRKEWGQINTFFIDDGGDYTRINMLPALQRAGKCSLVDWQKINHSLPCLDREWPTDKKNVIDGLLQQITQVNVASPIDWIFCSTLAGTLGPETLRAIAKLNVPIVSYSADDKHSYWQLMCGAPGNCPVTQYFDLSWTNSYACLPWYAVDGGRAIFLPEAAEPEVFYKDRQKEFKYSVSFVGQKYGKRISFFRYLAARGIQVNKFGPGWGRALSYQEMAKTCAESQINLGAAGVMHSGKVYCLKTRDFEVPLSGGLYLTQFSEEIARCYKINEEVICYGSPEDCVDIVRFLLANPEYCARVRKQGQERALREHTWDKRFKYILAFMEIIKVD